VAKAKKSTKKPSTSRRSKNQPEPKVLTPEDKTVDRMLIALQKTLSRVSRDSADVPEDQARALIVGSVSFELHVQCELGVGEKLMLSEDKGNPLTLTGQITSDVGVRLDKEADDGKA